MDISRYCLILGSVASFLIAVLHLALVFKPQWYHYFGADKLVELHEQGSSFTVLVTFGLAIFGLAIICVGSICPFRCRCDQATAFVTNCTHRHRCYLYFAWSYASL